MWVNVFVLTDTSIADFTLWRKSLRAPLASAAEGFHLGYSGRKGHSDRRPKETGGRDSNPAVKRLRRGTADPLLHDGAAALAAWEPAQLHGFRFAADSVHTSPHQPLSIFGFH